MSRAIAFTILIYTGYVLEEWDEVAGYIRQMSAVVSEMEGSAYYLELGQFMDLRIASRSGDRKAAAAVDALVNRPSVAFAKQHIPRYMMIAGDVHADLGNVAQARAYYAESLTGGSFGAQHWMDSEVQRRMGDLALSEGDAAQARTWYEAALATAQVQSATLFELRAALKLCALPEAGHEAAELLPSICARFNGSCPEFEAAQALTGVVVPA